VSDDQLNRKQALAVCHFVGFRAEKLVTAVAVMGAESGRKYLAFYVNPSGSTDRGLFQINDGAHPDLSDHDAYLPIPNARYAFKMSNGGKNWAPWAAYNSGRYLENMDPVQAELDEEKDGLWKISIADREKAFVREGDTWVPS
jgi:hypothetical protein